MDKLKVLAISGSLRKNSLNRKALQIAKQFAIEKGADVEELNLKELNLPVYDGDIEAVGLPDSTKLLKERLEQSDVIIIASPEYNNSIPGGLKNMIDWASRKGNSFAGKFAAVFGVSTGAFGTVRGFAHIRQILSALNVYMLPQTQVFIKFGEKAFNEDGSFSDPKTTEVLKKLIDNTLETAAKLKS